MRRVGQQLMQSDDVAWNLNITQHKDLAYHSVTISATPYQSVTALVQQTEVPCAGWCLAWYPLPSV